MNYYDRREGREKPLPDCGCAGLIWDAETQRCEVPIDFMSVFNGKRNQGLGFLSPEFEGDDFYNYGYDYLYNDWDFGGWDWSFNSGGDDWWNNFDPITGDYIGGGGADDWSWWDNFDPITGDYIGSGDTIFVGQTDAESPLPTVGNYNWQDFVSPWGYTPPDMPWNPWGDLGDAPAAPAGPSVPGYCQPGQYHPYPVGHPRQNECAPYPANANARRQAQQREQQRQQQQARQQQQQPQGQPCPRGQYRNQTTRRCEPIPTCPQGMVFSPVSQKCVPKTAASSTSGLAQLAKSPWLWILIAGGVLLASDSNSSGGGRRKR